MAILTRREALKVMGAAALAAGLGSRAAAQAASFPKGAVIRGLFRDYAPEELAGGATLFHEHLSLGPDFNDRFRAAAAAALAAQGDAVHIGRILRDRVRGSASRRRCAPRPNRAENTRCFRRPYAADWLA